MYIITEGDSTKALTFTENGNVKLTRYWLGDVNQIWTCYEADGWLSFGHTATYGSPVYLGYKPWPLDANLYCNAPSARFNEQFEARSRPKGGFQLRLRNGYGLEPLGWSGGGTLSRVRRGSPEVWWRFTKVQHPNPLLGVLPALAVPPLPVPTITLTSTLTFTKPPPVVPTVAPPPEPPYRRAGLSGDGVPLAGSTYIISEANSSKALTHNGDEGVMMSDYQKGLMTQRWGCHEADGWLGFTVETGQTTLFLGYSPWPSPATLRCSARTLQYSEMFMVTKLEEHGFRLKMKDGNALKPVGRDSSGALAMVGTSDVWWRFTKV
ncbi:hypothetical protein TWF970_002160 [Orbilia oligospora]|uniref:Uncharacterized protein n=1 Tax=Orbilia oligospora TaxID=2813651 RepID=A0A7C8VH85_ORBOL|nr:hypothetical protein TWF970_002160 [Orbilia oligospora]